MTTKPVVVYHRRSRISSTENLLLCGEKKTKMNRYGDKTALISAPRSTERTRCSLTRRKSELLSSEASPTALVRSHHGAGSVAVANCRG